MTLEAWTLTTAKISVNVFQIYSKSTKGNVILLRSKSSSAQEPPEPPLMAANLTQYFLAIVIGYKITE